MSLSPEFIRTSLQGLYGESIAAADIRAWCAMNGANYQTVTNKLADYKTSRGKWNLTVQEKLEQTYQAPTAMPAVEQNLIPVKDDTFVSFGNFADIKKLLSPVCFIQRSLRVFRVMVKRSLWNKHVLNWVENLSESTLQ